jgi:hypothetical protein
MNNKLVYLFSSAALVSQAAFATDHAAGFVNGTGVVLGTGFTQGTGKIIATNVQASRASKLDATIIKGHKYLITVTQQNWSQGMLSVVVGAPKATVSLGNIPVTAGSRGLTDIPDNFVTANGLRGPISILPIDSSADPNGAFRFVTGIAKFAQDDPMVFPRLPGASHLHMFLCNTGVSAYSTYRSLRTSGGTSCGDPKYPVNRSAYWVPALINGKGDAQVPAYSNIYYKSIPSSNPACGDPATGHIGFCIGIPNGLRYISGFNTSTMVMDPNSSRFECHKQFAVDDRTTEAPDSYQTIDDMVDAGCPAGSVLYILIEAPICWDGQNVDTANHRDHVHHPIPADGSYNITWTTNGLPQGPTSVGKCPLTHPYQIPSFSMQFYYNTKGDPTFLQKKWHLSSDEQMNPAVKGGTTLHMDYMEGWSPTVKDRWQQHCNEEHRSCSAGDLGDGYYIFTHRFSHPTVSGKSLVSRARLGWSAPFMGNGTFTSEVTAIDSGQLFVTSYDGLTSEITGLSVTDVTLSNNHVPVTLHGSH